MIEATMSYSGSSDTEAKAVGGVQSRPSLRTIWEQGRTVDGDEAFDRAVATIVAAAKRAGIGAAVLSSASLFARRAAQGFNMISITTDLAALSLAARSDLKVARSTASIETGIARDVCDLGHSISPPISATLPTVDHGRMSS
jgi:hypothetical protein